MPGAQVAFITRSGSNDFHGDVSATVRHEALNANDWFANRAGIGRLPQRFTEAGGAVGGPVVRNRTFFYASAEMLRLRHASVWRMAAPEGRIRDAHALLAGFPVPEGPVLGGGAAEHTASAAWPARVSTTSGRIDHALGTSGTLFVRGVFTPSRSDLGYLQTDRSRFRTSAVTVGAIHAISPALTHDLRVNISRSSVSTVWTPNTPAGAHPFDPASILPPPPEPGDAFYAVSIPGFGQLVSGAAGAARQMQWNLVQTLAWTRGRHQFRAGLDYQRVSPSRETPVLGIAGEYSSLAVLLAGRGPAVHFTLADSGSSLIETFSLFAQDTWQWTPRLTLTYGTRWDLTPAPSYRGRVTQGEFADPVLGADLPPGTQGQLFATPLWPTRATQFAPRAGLAWRANSEGTLVVRAGAGLFYDLGFPSSMDPLNGAPHNRWRLSVGTVPPTTTVLYGFAPELRLPYSLEWNFTVDRVWRSDTLVSAGYVGSAGRRLLRREGSFAERAGEARMLAATNHGASNYHALQLQARRRVARGLRGVASYTWSHSIDNGSWDSASFLLAPGTSDRGSSNFDVRHVFQGALTYDLPKLPHWTLSGFFRARTGFPIDVVSDDNVFGLGFDNAWRPDLAGGEPLWLPGRRLNPAAFRPPQRGEQGSLGRNAITGNGLAQLDLALERRFALARESVLTLRVETYNLLNRAHLADPLRFMGHPLFGEPLSQANLMLGRGRPASGLSPALQPGGQRTMQVGIRWQF
ncbi:MAG: TonB-dependent receptor [Bryobacterales bacterium]|nr:TonB-dependent receptor [Bryobacterales bacterium]